MEISRQQRPWRAKLQAFVTSPFRPLLLGRSDRRNRACGGGRKKTVLKAEGRQDAGLLFIT
jgi:hypothetical protein